MAAAPPVCEFGWTAPAFSLPATDGRVYSFADVAGPNGTLIMFICNHCPYVTSAIDRILDDARVVAQAGIGIAAICSNDAVSYPADSFPRMVEFAEVNSFPFPYLHDESQDVARSYDAACTPDFFGFNSSNGLQYRGRLDSGGPRAVPNAERELRQAMLKIAETGQGPDDQIASMGCSIKWRR